MQTKSVLIPEDNTLFWMLIDVMIVVVLCSCVISAVWIGKYLLSSLVMCCRSRAASHAMYDLDSAEIVCLLSKSPEPSMVDENFSPFETELIPSETHSVICSKCNFANPARATVCRECNSLLRGNEVFSSSFRKMYWTCLLPRNSAGVDSN